MCFLGKKGELTQLLKTLGQLSAEERPKMGEAINQAKVSVQGLIESRKQALEVIELEKRLEEERVDVTLPGRDIALGGLHPVTLTLNRIQNLFAKSGFEVDFIVGELLAIEVKASDRVNANDLKGISAFMQENVVKDYIVVSQDKVDKKLNSGITLLYWQSFLEKLWRDELIPC